MKNKFTLLKLATITLLFGTNIYAQSSYSLKQAIIANGGIFEFAAPYQDRATIGAYNPTSNIYTVFDTIEVESVQDIVLDSGYAYLAAQDSIVKYNLTTYQREAIAYFPALKKLEVSGNFLFVGKWYGSGDYFAVYNKHNLQPLFSISQVNQTVNGMVQVNDTIYVSYNIKGTIDLYPPWGVYADSIGKLAVIHAPTQTFVRDEILGEDAAGIGKLFVYNNHIYGICDASGKILKYNPATTADTFFNVGIIEYIRMHQGVLYGNFATGIQAYDLNTNTFLSTPLFTPLFMYASADYDFVNNHFYLTDTDYSSFGKLYKINGTNGQILDSINLRIAPEAIALEFNVNTSENQIETSQNSIRVFPNPFDNIINVLLNDEADLFVYDLSGKIHYHGHHTASSVTIDSRDWSNGVYIIQSIYKNNVQTLKLVK